MITETRPMTIEEFDVLSNDGNRHELVRGRLRVMPPPKGDHGGIEAAVAEELTRYLRERALARGWTPPQGRTARAAVVGYVGVGEVGLRFAVPDDPHQTRGADLVYIPPEQLAQVEWPQGEYFPAVPALVVEVVSKSDSANDVNEKVQDYLSGGARRVWVIYPDQQAVHVHNADQPTRVVRGNESLTEEELLPGFALPLNLIFNDQ